MPLLIDGVPLLQIPKDVDDLVKNHPYIQETAEVFVKKDCTVVGAEGLVCVLQKEYAVVTPADEKIHIIGSEDATTCHIFAVRHSGSGICCLGHLDGSETVASVNSMLDDVLVASYGSPEGGLEVFISGGFLDNRDCSVKLTKEILGALMVPSCDINLKLACVTDLNNTVRGETNYPVVYGMAMDVKTGSVYPAKFPDQGPDLNFRCATIFGGNAEFEKVYCSSQGKLVIGPLSWEPWSGIRSWLQAPDEIIRQHLSTSPEQEPDYYEAHVRAALQAICDHPSPHVSLFPGGHPRTYRKETSGEWVLIEQPA